MAAFAARELQRLPDSTAHFTAAIDAALGQGDVEAAGRLMISLSGNQAMGGRFDEALATLGRAAPMVSGYDRVVVDIQRATILRASDRLHESTALYRSVLAAIEAEGDEPRLADVHFNLGSTEMQLGSYVSALATLARAGELYRSLGRTRKVADTEHHLGLCAAWSGDVPRALAHFHHARQLTDEMGFVDGMGRLDAARTLLPARLAHEAEAEARDALARLREGDVQTWEAEAHLVLAQALLALGEPGAARTEADQAAAQFRVQQRIPSAVLAAKVALTAHDDLGSAATVDEARAIAVELDRFDMPVEAADVRVAAARAAVLRGDLESGRRAAADVEPRPKAAPAGLRIREAYAAAVVRHADRDDAGALASLEAGLEILERHRVSLGATELRVRASELGVDLADLGLRIARAVGSPDDVFRWAGLLRANSIDYRPARPPADAELREGLDAVRRAAREGAGPEELAGAEHRLVDALRRLRGGAAVPAAPAVPAAGTVAFFEQDGWLHRITVGGHTAPPVAVAPLADVKTCLAHLLAAWRRWIRLRARSPAIGQALHTGLRELDDLLELPGDDPGPIVVVPSEAVQGVPWMALPSFDGELRVAPSTAVAARPAREPGIGAVLVAGPGLDWSEREVDQVARLRPDASVCAGRAASCRTVLEAMEGADLVHFAAHGSLRVDNPLFSSLRLDDGPLTVCDLELLADPPRVVVLSACDAGRSKVHPGSEIMGLVAALLRCGADTVIAPVLPVEDAASVPVMGALHAELAKGTQPAAALHAAVRKFPVESPEGRLARSFVCFGAG